MRCRRVWLVLAAFLLICCASVTAAEHAEEGKESSGVFTGSWAESVWTIIWFLVLLAVLMKFAWKPILAGLQGREEHIQRQITEAEEVKKKAQETLAEYQAKVAQAQEEGQRIINSRMKDAEKQANSAKADLQRELEQMRNKAHADIERARKEAEEQLKREAGQMVFNLGEEILGRVITAEDNERLIGEAIEKLKQDSNGAAYG